MGTLLKITDDQLAEKLAEGFETSYVNGLKIHARMTHVEPIDFDNPCPEPPARTSPYGNNVVVTLRDADGLTLERWSLTAPRPEEWQGPSDPLPADIAAEIEETQRTDAALAEKLGAPQGPVGVGLALVLSFCSMVAEPLRMAARMLEEAEEKRD